MSDDIREGDKVEWAGQHWHVESTDAVSGIADITLIPTGGCTIEFPSTVALSRLKKVDEKPKHEPLPEIVLRVWNDGCISAFATGEERETQFLAKSTKYLPEASFRDITIDPNALTADELWERFKIRVELLDGGWPWYWWRYGLEDDKSDSFMTESAARRAATDWLREQGKL